MPLPDFADCGCVAGIDEHHGVLASGAIALICVGIVFLARYIINL
jgi:hypothetical protein